MGYCSKTRSSLKKLFGGDTFCFSPNRKNNYMDTRKFDLLELADKRERSKNAFERDLIDRTVDRIMRESGAVRKRREDLIMAVRNGDNRAIQRFQHELNMMQAEETKGREY